MASYRIERFFKAANWSAAKRIIGEILWAGGTQVTRRNAALQIGRTGKQVRIAVNLKQLHGPADDIATRREQAAVVFDVQLQGELELFEIVHALHPVCRFLGSRQSWQEHRGKNGNNSDDHQQLDQCETRF